MKILICVPVIPYPVADGLRARIFNLTRELARRHDVHLFCLSRMAPSREQEQAIAEAGMGLTVALKPFLSPEEKMTAYLKWLVCGVPPELILPWENLIFQSLKELHREHRFDAALGEHLFMGRFVLGVQCPHLLDEHNVEGELFRGLARTEKAPRRWWKLLAAAWVAGYEKKLLRRMQRVTAVTISDAGKFETMVPGLPVSVVENGVSCSDYKEIATATREPGDNLLFIGLMGYPATADAVEWFAAEILPLICRRRPETVFTVVGKEPPLLAGGGSRLKILEAFAAAVISLRENGELYQRLRVNARALVEEKYDWPVLAGKLEVALAETAGIAAGTAGNVRMSSTITGVKVKRNQ